MNATSLGDFVAHVRRLASDGAELYIQIGKADIRRLALKHGQHVEIDLGKVSVKGIVKASGSSAWLAPGASSNAEITATLRRAGFEHGHDVPAKLRSLPSASSSGDGAIGINNVRRPHVPDPRPTNVQRRGTQAALRDALRNFDWSQLYARYDAMCTAFRPDSKHLRAVTPAVSSDRKLYHQLFGVTQASTPGAWSLGAEHYEAMLYWKLYSQPAAVSNIARWFTPGDHARISTQLQRLLSNLPSSLLRDWPEINGVLAQFDSVAIPGMRSREALPVRTTFLHFFYPAVVPIFDKMVLQAVGMWSAGANTRLEVLQEYLPVAWELAATYEPKLVKFEETPLRLIDMALWVVRNS